MENTNESKITTPIAIIIAGFLVMVAILLTNGGGSKVSKEKTLSEQVGVNKAEFTQCMQNTDVNALIEKTSIEADTVMKAISASEGRGTPYNVIVGQNGSKAEIRGALAKEDVERVINEVKASKITTTYDYRGKIATGNYTGDIQGYREGDHIIGNPNAPILVIEYSDLECPFCKRFGDTMKKIVAESNGQVAWVYRHWIVHSDEQEGQQAHIKAAASECIAKIKGNEVFWQYIDLVFGLMDPVVETPTSEQL